MERIEKILKQRKLAGLLRQLTAANWRKDGKINFSGKTYFDFSSNDYLGLSNHPKLKQIAKKATAKYGVGSCASRLLSGNLKIHEELEKKTAQFKGKPAALVYNSGYQANLGVISALCGESDVVFCDKLSHASIIDAVLLSQAQLFRFRHNDVEHLKLLLDNERSKFNRALIITETIFSMDGDKCPLKELVTLKQKYDCLLMVDEAHATGIFGKTGAGIVEAEGQTSKVDLIMGTFGKALGSFGAYIACSKKIKEYLVNFSRSFIYSTSLPPAIIAVNILAIDLLAKESYRSRDLLSRSDYFREQLTAMGLQTKGCSQIIPIIIGDVSKTVKISKKLKKIGFWVLPIRPPTVPVNAARLRFSLNYNHNRKILNKLLNGIQDCI